VAGPRPFDVGAAFERRRPRGLLARVLYPRFTRALFGLDVMTDAGPDCDRISKQIDLGPVRDAVRELVPTGT